MSTKTERGAGAVVERVAHCVQDAVDECDLDIKQVRGVGIGAPGSVDPENGKVMFAGNLGWKDVSLKKELEKQLQLPVFLQNDCNVCTLGVHEVELEAKPRNMIGIFLGTGIGGGLIIEGRLYSGYNPHGGRGRPHGAGGQRPEMHVRKPGLLGGAGEPVGIVPAGAGGGKGRAEDRFDGDAGQ